MSEREVDRLERISAFYEKGDYMDRLLIDRCVELVVKSCRTRKNALEIGCGEGYSTAQLAPLFPGLEVLDGSAKNLELMKRRVQTDVVCHEGLLESFQPKKRYKNVFFLHVIEHVDDPIACLKRLETLLADEALLYLAAPNCMSLNRRAGHLMGMLDRYDTLAPKDHEIGHRRLYTVDMMREHCELAGLKIVDMKGVYLKPLSEKQMYELGDAAVRAFYRLGEDVPQYCADIFAVATRKYY